MSRLDELIQKLCPNGVEYRKVGDIADYEQPSKYLVKSTNYNDDFATPVLTAGQTFILGYTNETDGIYPASKDKPVIIFDDFTGAFKWVDFPFKAKSSAMKMITAKEKVLIRYLYHLMGFLNYSSDEHKRLWISTYSEFKFPVPPLEVQREIVHILDYFTLLTAELTAELTARKKQYEYYRDKLLKPHDNIPMMTLGEIGQVKMCKRILKKQTNAVGEVPFYKIGTFGKKADAYISKELFEEYREKYSYPKKGDILISCSGTIGRTLVFDGEPAYFQDSNIVWLDHDKTKVLNQYLIYCYSQQPWQIATGGTISRLYNDNILKAKIPVPPLDVQNRLVQVLDNFEAICSDLNIGLPAEIEARQKQYEYYRDALLTYAATGKIIDQTELNAIKIIQYVFGYVYIELEEVIHSLNTGLNPRQFFKLNTDDAENYYVTIREIQNGRITVSEKTDRINDEAMRLCNNRSNLEAGDVLFSGTGTIGETVVIENKPQNWNIKEGVYAIKPIADILDSKYLRYLLMSGNIKTAYMKKVTGGTVQSIPMKELRKIAIPLPLISEQKRIASLIDRFDTLCNDLTSGLPAEIEARQKQYEYYRDKLLRFE